MLKQFAFGVALISGVALTSVAHAAEYYRYINDKGVTVLNKLGVPPEFIGKGYDVVDEHGRVLRSIPPAPSAEERKRLAAQREQAKSDAQLLRIYSEADDVDRARDRKMAELDGVISVAQSNLNSMRTQQANLQAKAADFERSGREVPEHLLVQIDNIKAEQLGLEKDIGRYREARKAADAAFAVDRARLVELRGE